MICRLFLLQFGLAIAVMITVHYTLLEPKRRRRAWVPTDLSGYFAGVDLSISPEEIAVLGFESAEITIAGRYDDSYIGKALEGPDEAGLVRVELGWPFATINKDSMN